MKFFQSLNSTIAMIGLLLSVNSTKLNSQQWPPLGPCYNLGNCTRTGNSVVLEYMGCQILVVYQMIHCPPGQHQIQIDYITYSAGGNCAALHLFLHPNNNFEPDANRYMQMKKDVYKMLFDNRWSAIRNNFTCPQFAEFVYWWEGNCAMACEIVLENGEHVFFTRSCQDTVCCGKRFTYCVDPLTQQDIIYEFTYWVGTACPPQTAPDFSLCPSSGDYHQGVRIVNVYVTYCISTCFDE